MKIAYHIRKAQAQDVKPLAELDKRCFASPWSEQSFEEDVVNNPLAFYLVAESDQGEIIGYAGVYLITLILLSILTWILVKIAELPVIKKVDKTLGCILGVCSAFVYASVYTLLLFAIFSLIEGYNPEFAFHAAYDKSWLFRLFYDINVFRLIFGIG